VIRAVRKIARWGQSAAGAYAAGAQLRPREPAVIDDLGELTFAEVHERTNRLGSALPDVGIGAGDSVALMCRNHRGFVETVVALSKLGANTLLLNTGFAGPQLADVVERENPGAVVYDQEFTNLVGGALHGRQGFVA
jgi:fatty-acyl-CoA synthase